MTTRRLGVVMDPIGSIRPAKDSTLAMLLAARNRGWGLVYMEQTDLLVVDGGLQARMRPLSVRDDPDDWYSLGEPEQRPIDELDVVLMRKDPPFDIEYVYTTHLLDLAEAAGVLVVNRPRALRDTNEKLATLRFPDCTPPSLLTRDEGRLRVFLAEHGDIIVKPLAAMGGASVFRLTLHDPNVGVVFETMTDHGRRYTLAQRYIPEIVDGDKRILMIDGEPVPWCLARLPAPGETRANLAAGGEGVARALSDRDRWICRRIGPWLREQGLWFVGIDVIGDYLTEINVTSPTCIREIDRQRGTAIADELMDRIEVLLRCRR